jgi:hypothetical protein
MGEPSNSPLVKVSRSELASEDPLGDVRGRMVAALDDDLFGTVADQLLDHREKTTRFLEIDEALLVGLGQRTFLVPAQVVDRADDRRVYLSRARDVISSAPAYNPHVVLTAPYLVELFEHFGCPLPSEAEETLRRVLAE